MNFNVKAKLLSQKYSKHIRLILAKLAGLRRKQAGKKKSKEIKPAHALPGQQCK